MRTFLTSLGIDTPSLEARGRSACAAMAPPSSTSPIDGKLAGTVRDRRPRQAIDAGGAEGAGGRRHQGHHADRRQPHHGERRRAAARHRRGRGRSASRAEERRGRASCRSAGPDRRDGRRRRQRRAGAWPPRKSASPWAPAPMWRWKAPASRCSKGDLGGIVRARQLSQATMRNIRQNLFFAFIYNAAGIPIAAGILYPTFRHPAVADHRRRRHGAVVGQRRRQRAATAGHAAVIEHARFGDH